MLPQPCAARATSRNHSPSSAIPKGGQGRGSGGGRAPFHCLWMTPRISDTRWAGQLRSAREASVPRAPGARSLGVGPAAAEQSKSALASVRDRGTRRLGILLAKAKVLRHLKEKARGAAARAAVRAPLSRRGPSAPLPLAPSLRSFLAGAAAPPSLPLRLPHPLPQRAPLPFLCRLFFSLAGWCGELSRGP